MKTDRLFQILYILLEKGSVSAPELSSMLEVSVRTIYRDVEVLSLSGVPIYATQGKGGGISLMDGYAFDKALLSDEEQNQVLFALQGMQVADRHLDGVLKKLGAAFQKQGTKWIEVDFSRWGRGSVDSKRFDLLKNAILQKRVVNILYCGMSGTTTRRAIKPFKLVFKDKNWYLQAFCLKAADYRLFKVSRIREQELTEIPFYETFEDAPPLDKSLSSNTPTIALRLRFSPSLAFRVFDEFEIGEITKEDDGFFVVKAIFPYDDWVVNYLLSFGTGMEILDPLEMRAQVASYVKKLSLHYET